MDEDAAKIERIVGAVEPQNILVHPKWRDRLDYFLVAAVVLLIAGTTALGWVAYRSLADAHDNARRVSQVSSALREANQRILQLGGKPVSTPVTQAPVTDAQILGQVAVYFSRHPVPSPTVDYATLHDYVVAYLANHPAPPGRTGSRGPTGASGPPGPGPSDSQLERAISAYFSAHPPQPGPTGATGPAGPPGSAGPSGPPGPTGNGILRVDCSSSSSGPPAFQQNFTFTITYDNGTVQTVTCSNSSPTPTPTP